MNQAPEAERPLTLSAVADCALLIEFENHISETTSEQVLGLSWRLRKAGIDGVLEAVPGYRSLLVHYDPMRIDFDSLSSETRRLALQPDGDPQPRRRWRVPVHYGGEAGLDLAEVARLHGISEAEVIRIHSSGRYRVYMMGFAPGWTYLGGLDQRLHTPRLPAPRPKVPAGCISIGGQQAMIGGLSMPSGWRLLGQTPVRSYAPEREQAFFISAGDEVTFQAVDQDCFEELRQAGLRGERVAEELPPLSEGAGS